MREGSKITDNKKERRKTAVNQNERRKENDSETE
jgi:hypothetical protein